MHIGINVYTQGKKSIFIQQIKKKTEKVAVDKKIKQCDYYIKN